MEKVISAAAPALCGVAIGAVELFRLLYPQPGAGTTAAAAQAQALRSAVRAFLPLAAAGGLFTTVVLIYRHFRRAAAAAAGNRRLSEFVTFLLCASAGFLDFFLFVAPAPGAGGADPAGVARELGLAALRAMPAAATATFYLGMLLIIIRHIRAGGEGGGGAVAGDGPVEAPAAVGLLAKMAIGAVVGLVCLMAIALYGA